MKFSLDWHRQGIESHANSLQRYEEDVQQRLAALTHSRARLEFARAQLAEAERRGLTEYDADKLLVKRKQTPTPQWPAGCQDTGSCESHRACMYAKCQWGGTDIGPMIDAALAALKKDTKA